MKKQDSVVHTLSRPVRTYLLLFNGISAVLWYWMALKLLLFTLRGNIYDFDTLWKESFPLVLIAQSLALAEPFHVSAGWTSGRPLAAFMQVLSREQIIVLIWMQVPETRNNISLYTCLVAWTSIELVRYPFYSLKCLALDVPYWLNWSRYTMFMFLYPVGITSELAGVWVAVPIFWKSHHFSHFPVAMPNPWNFELNLAIGEIAMLFLYTPGAYFLYTYMLSQRRKFIKKHRSVAK